MLEMDSPRDWKMAMTGEPAGLRELEVLQAGGAVCLPAGKKSHLTILPAISPELSPKFRRTEGVAVSLAVP